MASPKVLFVHENFPAQFGQFGQWLAGRGWDVVFATAREGARSDAMRILPWRRHREPTGSVHPYARPMESAAIAAQGFARAALAARAQGYAPHVVMAHAGWGAGMFAKDLFPAARSVPLFEWWYRTPAPDAAFLGQTEPSADAPPDTALLQDARNAPIAMDLANSDAAVCPTDFQAGQFPPRLRGLLTVMHDGIDTDLHAPDPAGRRGTLRGLVPEDAEVITYATRGQEPHRGFPQFVRALPAVFAARPKAHAVIVGENRVAYGGQAQRAVDWRAALLEEVSPDPARVHFTGLLPRPDYLAVLRRSDVHCYLTVPFVLSWSMLEAMSTGCLLVASDTEPVREFAADGETALLTAFFDHAALAGRLIEALEQGPALEPMRRRARGFVVETLSSAVLWPRREALLRGGL